MSKLIYIIPGVASGLALLAAIAIAAIMLRKYKSNITVVVKQHNVRGYKPVLEELSWCKLSSFKFHDGLLQSRLLLNNNLDYSSAPSVKFKFTITECGGVILDTSMRWSKRVLPATIKKYDLLLVQLIERWCYMEPCSIVTIDTIIPGIKVNLHVDK